MPGGPELPAFDEESLKPKFSFGLPGKVKIVVILVGGMLVTVGLGRFVWGGLGMSVSEPALVGDNMEGTFTIYSELFGFPSDGFGGACMIGDFAKLISNEVATAKGVVKTACTQDAQCNPTLPDGTPNPQKWYGYCVADAGGQGRCWYKPTDGPEPELCEKSVYTNPVPQLDGSVKLVPNGAWSVGDHRYPKDKNAFKVQEFYDLYTGGKPVQWRTVGLLLGTKAGTALHPGSDPVCISSKGLPC